MGTSQTTVMVRGERTILTKANDKSYSLRTTLPTGIAKQLDLKEGDSIFWKLQPDGKEFIIVVEPVRAERKEKKNR
jgi:hypothetical protein